MKVFIPNWNLNLYLHIYCMFAFLESYDLVIISSLLSQVETKKLLRVLHEHKMSIAWSILDIKCHMGF